MTYVLTNPHDVAKSNTFTPRLHCLSIHASSLCKGHTCCGLKSTISDHMTPPEPPQACHNLFLLLMLHLLVFSPLIFLILHPCQQQIGPLPHVVKLYSSPCTKPSQMKALGLPLLDQPTSRTEVTITPCCMHLALPLPTTPRSRPIRRIRKDSG